MQLVSKPAGTRREWRPKLSEDVGPDKMMTDNPEIPDDCLVLIGRFPLEGLDFVVDPVGRRLIGNPEHGGEHMIGVL